MKNFKTHNEIPDLKHKLKGAYRVARVCVGFDALKQCFGHPLPGDGQKTDVKWFVLFDCGTIASVYNYCNGPTYGEYDGLKVEEIKEWSIGGVDVGAGGLVYAAIKSCLAGCESMSFVDW